MPLVPVVLLLGWHAVSRSASFALGWAIAIFFGQIPGNRGRVLAIILLIGAAWLIVLVGAALPLAAIQLGIATGILPGVPPGEEEASLYLVAAVYGIVILAPPLVPVFAETGGFGGERSFRRLVSRLPLSYALTPMIGISVLLMVVIAPVVIVRRMREGRKVLQVPMVIIDEEGLEETIRRLDEMLARFGHPTRRGTATGPVSWPMRTLGFVARHLLGSVVRGNPVKLVADDGAIEIVVHSTDVAITGPAETVYPLRAAIERELAFSRAFLTWSEDSQRLEEEVRRLHEERDGDPASLIEELDRFQERLDAAPLKSDEWNILYRLRLQVERQARLEATDGRSAGEAKRKVQRTG